MDPQECAGRGEACPRVAADEASVDEPLGPRDAQLELAGPLRTGEAVDGAADDDSGDPDPLP